MKSPRRILVQVNSSFDLYMLSSLIKENTKKDTVDLLAPRFLATRVPEDIKNIYSNIYTFDEKIRNLFSLRSILETIRISFWSFKNRDYYNQVLFGAYRNDITSVLAKHFAKKSELIAIKQGIDLPDKMFDTFFSLRKLHDRIYFFIFGYSGFLAQRQKETNDRSSDFLFTRPKWLNDPFKKNNVYTIGRKHKLLDGYNFIYPNLKTFLKEKNLKNDQRRGVFIVGERTPMVTSWSNEQDKILKEVFNLIKKESENEQIYLRARKNLTNKDFYKDLKPELLDINQPYDDQIISINPRIIISIKSTASKVGSYYGFNSLILYPMMNFTESEKTHLDYLFGDGAPIKFIKEIGELKTELQDKILTKPKNSEDVFITKDFLS